MEDYQDKHQKLVDFLKGLLINLIAGVAVCAIYLLFMFLLLNFESDTVNRILAGIVVAALVLGVFIFEFNLIRKHLKGKRYIAIGMIVALVLPLLAFGTCSTFLFDMVSA